MPTVSKNPTVASQSGTEEIWVNPDKALVVDGQVSATTGLAGTWISRQLRLTHLDYLMPEDHRLGNLAVRITRRAVGAGGNMKCSDNIIQLVCGGVLIGSNMATTTAWLLSGLREDTYNFDISELTKEILEDDTFGIAISASCYDLNVPAFGIAPQVDGVVFDITHVPIMRGIWQESALGMMVNQPRAALGI